MNERIQLWNELLHFDYCRWIESVRSSSCARCVCAAQMPSGLAGPNIYKYNRHRQKKNNNKHFIWLDVIITINGSWIAANSFAVINVRVYYCMRIPNHGWTYLLWLFIIESWTGKHTRMNICWSMQESGDVWSVRGKWKTELNCGSNPIMGWYWMRFVRHMLYYSLHFFFLLPYREWQCVTLLFIISTVDLMENIIWLERRGAVDAFAWISIPHRLWM